MKKLKFELTLEDVNKILSIIGKQPYEVVFTLVSDLSMQARAQLDQQSELQPASDPQFLRE